jgi:hypothetical protein
MSRMSHLDPDGREVHEQARNGQTSTKSTKPPWISGSSRRTPNSADAG